MAKQRSNEPGADTPPTDDAQAFRAAVRDVKRLAHTPPPQGLATPKKRARRRAMPALEDLDAAMPLAPVSEAGGHAGAGAPGGPAGAAAVHGAHVHQSASAVLTGDEQLCRDANRRRQPHDGAGQFAVQYERQPPDLDTTPLNERTS